MYTRILDFGMIMGSSRREAHNMGSSHHGKLTTSEVRKLAVEKLSCAVSFHKFKTIILFRHSPKLSKNECKYDKI